MLVQLNSQLEKFIKKDVSIVNIYEHPNIKALAQFLGNDEQNPGISEVEFEQIKQKVEKGKTKLEQRKQRSKGIAG